MPSSSSPKNKWRTVVFVFAALCLMAVLSAGCMGDGTPETAPAVTPAAPAIASPRALSSSISLDPIVGIWRSPGPAYLFRIAFDVNGKTGETFANLPGVNYNGTWQHEGGNAYLVTRDTGEKLVWIYSPDTNTISKQSAPGITYSLYQGVASASTPAAVLSGTGNMVVPFTATETGQWAFTMSYSGAGNYIVWLTDNGGSRLALLANEIGTYSGTSPKKLAAGKYYLDVTAGGPWTIQAALS